MTIVVDTNLIFSAILNSSGIIGNMIMSVSKNHSLIAPFFLLEELDKHHNKMMNISGLSSDEVYYQRSVILKRIKLIEPSVISMESWQKAFNLTRNIDPDDTPFVALAMEFGTHFWTGDKKLLNGLNLLGISWIKSTSDLKNMISK